MQVAKPVEVGLLLAGVHGRQVLRPEGLLCGAGREVGELVVKTGWGVEVQVRAGPEVTVKACGVPGGIQTVAPGPATICWSSGPTV
jgi:hypothetical protein